jgi:pectate lyase
LRCEYGSNANVATTALTSLAPKVLQPQPDALHGAPVWHVKLPSTKTTGARTTSQMLQLSNQSHSMSSCISLDSLLIKPSDNAGVLGITITSNKSLIGQGAKGVIKGKGIRMVSGAKNIIVQ